MEYAITFTEAGADFEKKPIDRVGILKALYAIHREKRLYNDRNPEFADTYFKTDLKVNDKTYRLDITGSHRENFDSVLSQIERK